MSASQLVLSLLFGISWTRSMLISSLFVLLLLLSSTSSSINAAIPEHKVTSPIPNFPPLLSNWYSGYLNVTSSIDGETRQMYYLFMEVIPDPTRNISSSSAPVILCTGNGPGGSTQSYNYMETGPFTIRLGGTWTQNNFTYNNRANLLYVDMPAGVGFSIDYELDGTEWTDEITTEINYKFLKKWFSKFPEYRLNDFYINGISYSGHYTPMLASSILHGDDDQLKRSMKGWLLGSPCIGTGFRSGPLADLDWCFTTNTPGAEHADPTLPVYFQTHSYEPYGEDSKDLKAVPNPQLVADPPWDLFIAGLDIYWLIASSGEYCEEEILPPGGDKGNGGGGDRDEEKEVETITSSSASSFLFKTNVGGSIERKAVDASSSSSFYSKFIHRRKLASAQQGRRHITKNQKHQKQMMIDKNQKLNTRNGVSLQQTATSNPMGLQPNPNNVNTNNQLWKLPISPYEPCNGEYLFNWLNRADVQKALNVYQQFKGRIFYDTAPYEDFTYRTPNTTRGMKTEYFDIMNNTDWKVMIVSGTEEVSVNFLQSQQVIASFGRTPITNYTPWYYPDPYTGKYRQMGGWQVTYDRISWASIIGAGHSAAMTSPAKMYQLFLSFLDNDGKPGMKPNLKNESVRTFYGIVNPDDENRNNNQNSNDDGGKMDMTSFKSGFGAGFGSAMAFAFVIAATYAFYNKKTKNGDTNNNRYQQQHDIERGMTSPDQERGLEDSGTVAVDTPSANRSRNPVRATTTASSTSSSVAQKGYDSTKVAVAEY